MNWAYRYSFRVLMVVYRALRKSSSAKYKWRFYLCVSSNLAHLLSLARKVNTFYLRLVYGNAAALLRMILTRDQCELRKEALSGARYDRDMVLNHHLSILTQARSINCQVRQAVLSWRSTGAA